MNIRFILNPISGGKRADLEYIAKCIELNFPGAHPGMLPSWQKKRPLKILTL